MGWGHHPAAYSPWGGEGPAARALLFEVTKRATADLQGWPRTQRMLEIRQGLSLALARGVAAQLALRCPVAEACTKHNPHGCPRRLQPPTRMCRTATTWLAQ